MLLLYGLNRAKQPASAAVAGLVVAFVGLALAQLLGLPLLDGVAGGDVARAE